jgi:hypothetical protein
MPASGVIGKMCDDLFFHFYFETFRPFFGYLRLLLCNSEYQLIKKYNKTMFLFVWVISFLKKKRKEMPL